MPSSATATIRVADEVWIATALLHRENPSRADFTVSEITNRAKQEGIHSVLRPGVYQHAFQHCVANEARDTGTYRMLFATGKLTRRLFCAGDRFHPSRQGSKIVPNREQIPSRYHYLLDWYASEYCANPLPRSEEDSILALRGLGKEIWADENPDEYVRRLREGWE
jgi:hypothetical protein